MLTIPTRWRGPLAWGCAAIALLAAVPAAGLTVGDSISAPLLEGQSESIVADWRSARLAYRVGRLSPFFWPTLDEREDAVDRALSGVYLTQVVDGTIPEHAAHLDFLDNRSQDVAWRPVLLETMLRYGDAEGVLKAADSDAEACAAVGAAITTGSRESLAAWLPRCRLAPAALWLLADLHEQAPAGDGALGRFIQAEGLRRSGDTEGARQAHSALLDGELAPWSAEALILTLSDPADLPPALSAAPADDPRWMGAWLAAAALHHRAGQPEAAAEATDRALTLSAALPDLVIAYRFLSAPYLPHPGRFEPLLDLTEGETQARLRLLQARAALQGMDISSAQSALKPIRELEVPDAVHAERLMLRTLARELSGDLDGAQKYAAEGEALDPARFKLILARVMMLGGEREAPLSLLESLAHYPLSEDLSAQHTEALLLCRRLNGMRAGFTLAGHVAEETVYKDDDVFRLWLTDYLAESVASPQPTPSLVLPALRYWRGAGKHGEFLIGIRLDSALSVPGEMVRAHLSFQRGQLTSGDASGWSDLSAARVWAMEEPFRFLLPHAAVPYREGSPR